MWMARLYPTYEPSTCLTSNGLSAMAFALPGAIGAKLAEPGRRVLAAAGDGAFLMNSQEIETALRERPDLPLGDPGGQRLGGFGVLEPLTLGLALGFGLRHRDVRGLPPLLDRVPAVQGRLRRHAVPGQHITSDLLSVPGGGLGACVQEDLRVTRADGDAAADLAADVFFHLTQGTRLLRRSGVRLAGHGDGHAPVITVCHW